LSSKNTIGISIIAVILSLISLIWFINYSTERTEAANERLQDAINDLDRIVDKAIIHCQTDGTGCDVLMPQWLEECKKPEMKDIPSCHDGRIEQLLEIPIMMSEECRELKEIMGRNQLSASDEAVSAYEQAMDEYDRLGCP